MNPDRRRPLYGVFLLAYQVFNVMGMERIPPVTLAFVGLHSAIFLRLFKLPWYTPLQVCISAGKVWYGKEYHRLLYAAFEHGDDWHLYFNMISFIMKGQALERRFGSVKFFYLTTMFTLLTNIAFIALSMLASELDSGFGHQCAVGFSGVIFALKVLTSYYYPNYNHQIMGIPIMMPANYAVWLELILIQLLVPNASLIGHLAGVLIGLAYVKGPLRPILDGTYTLIASVFKASSPPRFTPRAEATGYRPSSGRRNFDEYTYGLSEEDQLRMATEASTQSSTQHPTPGRSFAEYTHGLSEEDELRIATEASLGANQQAANSNLYPNLEEVRNRRLARYT